MENTSELGEGRSSHAFLFGAIFFAIFAVALVAFALAGQQTGAQNLLPALATPTPLSVGEAGLPPAVVTFTELNADPVSYLNKPIEVSGEFLRLDPPACPKYSGPKIAWALVADQLQLEAMGFERVIRILDPGTEMTVQGIWRLYQGPLGCGKGPSAGSAWYLQVQKILQPNPLVGSGSASQVDIQNIGPGLPELMPTGIPTPTPSVTPTPEPATAGPAATAVQPTPPSTTLSTATSEPTLDAIPTTTPTTLSGTAPAGSGAVTPSATPSVTVTGGPGSGGSAPTATLDLSIAPTATQDPDGYPAPASPTPQTSYP